MSDRRLATLRAALGFLELPPRAPELRLITMAVERLDTAKWSNDDL
jgi:hypothetical protein